MELKGIRVLVTGAGGFIGSHLCELLVREGCRVNAFVRYKSDGSHGWLDRSALKTEMEVFAGDVTDTESIRKAMQDCEVVFHLAALIGIPYSYKAPQSYVRTNVEGTLNVLTAARDMGLKRIIHTSTSEVYGTPETVPITETHPLRAQSPYAATKIAADKLSESFYNSFELPVTVLRPFNTYGPRQSTRAVVPVILTQLLSGSSQIRLGALEPRRDLTFVTDTANGFVMAAKSDKAIGKTVQLGTGRDISIGELASLAMNVTGHKAEIICDDKRLRPPQSEVERLLSEPALAEELLGWHALVSLEDGIDHTAKWLKENIAGYKIGQYAV
jgi:NAD dependent epimerase/dehydratase